MVSHVVSLKIYLGVFTALLVFTGVTVWIAYVDLGPLNIHAAMTIAVVKALLVVLFFMHLRYSSGLTKLFVFAGILWLGILFAITLSDYVTRGWSGLPQGWVNIEENTPDPLRLTKP